MDRYFIMGVSGIYLPQISDRMASYALICDTKPWKDLKIHVEEIKKTRLRDLMNDIRCCTSMMVEFEGLVLDYSRQRAGQDTVQKLFKLAESVGEDNESDSWSDGSRSEKLLKSWDATSEDSTLETDGSQRTALDNYTCSILSIALLMREYPRGQDRIFDGDCKTAYVYEDRTKPSLYARR